MCLYRTVQTELAWGYCGSIQHCSELYRKLRFADVTKKNMAWQWLSDHKSSFQKLKDAFLKCPVLYYPNTDLLSFVMTLYLLPVVLCWCRRMAMEISTPVPIIQRLSLLQSEIMISIIMNFLWWYVLSRNGGSISWYQTPCHHHYGLSELNILQVFSESLSMTD